LYIAVTIRRTFHLNYINQKNSNVLRSTAQMKLWQRAKKNDLGKVLISWTFKAPSRFLTKILTWILGAFVFGIFTSIAFHTIGLTDIALPFARIVFFIVLALGIVDAFFRNIVNGNEYRVTENGLIHVKPYCGYDQLAEFLESTNIQYFNKHEYIAWEHIKEIKETQTSLAFIIRKTNESLIAEINGIIKVKNYNEDGNPLVKKAKISTFSFYSKDEKFDKEVKKAIIQKARLAIEGQKDNTWL
jgi:hypothetical protein